MLFPSFICSLLIVSLIAFRRDPTKCHVAVLLCMSAALYGFDLGSYYITLNGHEVLVSETVVEMRRRGNWLVPMLNDMPRLYKPPMQYWLVGLVSGLTGGVDELSSRLPSAFFGIGLVLMTYAFGRRIFDEGVAFLAGAVQAGNIFMIKFAREATTDIGNVFFVFAAFVCAWFILEGKDNKRLWQAGLWACLALDMLVKGPFGVVTTLFTITVYALYFRRGKDLKEIYRGWAILLFFALALPWYLYIAFGIEGTWHTWYKQTFMRVEGGLLTKAPWYFYFPATAALLAQWTLILPWAIARVFSKSEVQRRKILFYLLFWFAVEFLLISFSSAKRDRYLLWGLTPLAYLISIELIDLGDKLKKHMKARFIVGISGAAIGVLLTVAGLYLNGRFEWLSGNLRYLIPAISLACIILSGLIYAGRVKEAIVIFFAIEVIFFMAGSRLLGPCYNHELSLVTFSKEIPRMVPEDRKIFAIDASKPAIIFYSGRTFIPVTSVEQAMQLDNGRLPIYIITNDYMNFSKQYPQFQLLASSVGTALERNSKPAGKIFGLFMGNTAQ